MRNLFLSLLSLAAFAVLSSCSKESSGQKTFSNAFYNGHEAVDLGLPSGTLWATCNIGAESYLQYGDYFAWGETSTKRYYSRETSKTIGIEAVDLIKKGWIDGDCILTSKYDAASCRWGGEWKVPSYKQIKELVDNCRTEWGIVKGVAGRKVTGKNGKSIFLPAAGYRDYDGKIYSEESTGRYWGANPEINMDDLALSLHFDSDEFRHTADLRYVGYTIRPVILPSK